MTDLSLRVRIFLFFCLIGGGSVVVVAGALWFSYARAQDPVLLDPFVLAGLISTLALLGLSLGIWRLFDENVARPIDRLAAEMRTRTHADVSREITPELAKYLGDLAPAAAGLAGQLSASSLNTAEALAKETRQLQRDRQALSGLLSEIPVAVALINPDFRIVLYDKQTASILVRLGTPRLNASLWDYLDPSDLGALHSQIEDGQTQARGKVRSASGAQELTLTLKQLKNGEGHLLIFDDAQPDLEPQAERPLVFDFELMRHGLDPDLKKSPLNKLGFIVFDTETTGLLPHKDEIVQIGAVHVLNGALIAGDRFDALVDPGRPIPAASTKVHKITDAMVAGAPDIGVVGQRLHAFAAGSVMVAHNAPFDFAFLRRHRKRMGVEWDMPILDTVLLSAVLFGVTGVHTLDALCTRLDVSIPAELRHTAMGDAVGTAQVLCKMLPILQARGFETLGDVIAASQKHRRLLDDLNPV